MSTANYLLSVQDILNKVYDVDNKFLRCTIGTKTVNRDPSNLPASTQSALFNVVGGKIIMLGIYGEVTTVIETKANATKLVANPTTGADVNLCATQDITAAAVGTMLNITGTLSEAMVETASGAVKDQVSSVIVAPGTIDLNCAATSTGQVEWTIIYVPIDSGAYVTVA